MLVRRDPVGAYIIKVLSSVDFYLHNNWRATRVEMYVYVKPEYVSIIKPSIHILIVHFRPM